MTAVNVLGSFKFGARLNHCYSVRSAYSSDAIIGFPHGPGVFKVDYALAASAGEILAHGQYNEDAELDERRLAAHLHENNSDQREYSKRPSFS